MSEGADPLASETAFAIRPMLLLACGVAANLLLSGFGFPCDNNLFHVPIVLDYTNSTEGPHDAFDQSLTGFVSALWPALSLISTEHNIFWVFLSVYVLNRAAFLLFIYLSAWEVAGRRAGSLALICGAAILILWPAWRLSPLGFSDLFNRCLSQTPVALTLVVACVWLMLRGRWLATGLCLGLAFNLNAFIGVWGAAIGLAGYLWLHRGNSMWSILRGLIGPGLALALVSLPTFIWILATVARMPAATYDYRSFITEYFPQHNLVSSNWAGLVIAACLAGLVVNYLRNAELFREARQRQLLLALFVSLLAILAAGCVAPYIVNSRLLYNLYPLRMDSLLLPLFILLSAATLATVQPIQDPSFWRHALLLLAVANGNLPLALAVSMIAARPQRNRWRDILPALLLLVCALCAVLTGDLPIYGRHETVAELVVLALAQSAVAGIAFRLEALRTGPLLLLLALIVSAMLHGSAGDISRYAAGFLYVATAASALFGSGWRLGLPALLVAFGTGLTAAGGDDRLLAATLALPVVAIGSCLGGRIPWTRPPLQWAKASAFGLIVGGALIAGGIRAAISGTINYMPPRERALVDTELWLRAHSHPDESVLALGAEGFSTLSRRPVWIDRKVGAAAMWSPNYYAIWHTRYSEIMQLHNIDQALAYAQQHKIPYLVIARDYFKRDAGEPRSGIYANSYFTVFSAASASPRGVSTH